MKNKTFIDDVASMSQTEAQNTLLMLGEQLDMLLQEVMDIGEDGNPLPYSEQSDSNTAFAMQVLRYK